MGVKEWVRASGLGLGLARVGHLAVLPLACHRSTWESKNGLGLVG